MVDGGIVKVVFVCKEQLHKLHIVILTYRHSGWT